MMSNKKCCHSDQVTFSSHSNPRTRISVTQSKTNAMISGYLPSKQRVESSNCNQIDALEWTGSDAGHWWLMSVQGYRLQSLGNHPTECHGKPDQPMVFAPSPKNEDYSTSLVPLHTDSFKSWPMAEWLRLEPRSRTENNSPPWWAAGQMSVCL